MARSPQPARSASALTRAFFNVLDRSRIPYTDIHKSCGIHPNTLYYWKTGRAAPTIINMEAALSVLGLKLVIQPIEPEPEKDLS